MSGSCCFWLGDLSVLPFDIFLLDGDGVCAGIWDCILICVLGCCSGIVFWFVFWVVAQGLVFDVVAAVVQVVLIRCSQCVDLWRLLLRLLLFPPLLFVFDIIVIIILISFPQLFFLHFINLDFQLWKEFKHCLLKTGKKILGWIHTKPQTHLPF